LFLDEATSALDEITEKKIYEVLSERLPQTTLVSIGHRSGLLAYHTRKLEITTSDSGNVQLISSAA